MSKDKYLYRTLPKKLEEFEDPELRKEIDFLREKEGEAEKRIEERIKSNEPERPIDKKQRKKSREDMKNLLIAIPLILIGPFLLLFAFILFAAIPGSTIIALIICFIAIASMVWAWHKNISME